MASQLEGTEYKAYGQNLVIYTALCNIQTTRGLTVAEGALPIPIYVATLWPVDRIHLLAWSLGWVNTLEAKPVEVVLYKIGRLLHYNCSDIIFAFWTSIFERLVGEEFESFEHLLDRLSRTPIFQRPNMYLEQNKAFRQNYNISLNITDIQRDEMKSVTECNLPQIFSTWQDEDVSQAQHNKELERWCEEVLGTSFRPSSVSVSQINRTKRD